MGLQSVVADFAAFFIELLCVHDSMSDKQRM